MKKLLVFGDSYPWGAELQFPHLDAFPVVLSAKLGVELTNLSKQGTSIDQAVLTMVSTLETIGDCADLAILFCFTSYSRAMIFEDGADTELHSDNRDLVSLSYYANVYSDQLGQFNFLKSILAVQGVCKKMNIPLYCVANFNDLPSSKLIDTDLFYRKSILQILGIGNITVDSGSDVNFARALANSDYIKPNDGHPNKVGHQLIAEELYTWINSR
jgi:hypothetical protein